MKTPQIFLQTQKQQTQKTYDTLTLVSNDSQNLISMTGTAPKLRQLSYLSSFAFNGQLYRKFRRSTLKGLFRMTYLLHKPIRGRIKKRYRAVRRNRKYSARTIRSITKYYGTLFRKRRGPARWLKKQFTAIRRVLSGKFHAYESRFESRLDFWLYKLQFTRRLTHSIMLLKTGNVKVNGKTETRFDQILHPLDVVSFSPKLALWYKRTFHKSTTQIHNQRPHKPAGHKYKLRHLYLEPWKKYKKRHEGEESPYLNDSKQTAVIRRISNELNQKPKNRYKLLNTGLQSVSGVLGSMTPLSKGSTKITSELSSTNVRKSPSLFTTNILRQARAKSTLTSNTNSTVIPVKSFNEFNTRNNLVFAKTKLPSFKKPKIRWKKHHSWLTSHSTKERGDDILNIRSNQIIDVQNMGKICKQPQVSLFSDNKGNSIEGSPLMDKVFNTFMPVKYRKKKHQKLIYVNSRIRYRSSRKRSLTRVGSMRRSRLLSGAKAKDSFSAVSYRGRFAELGYALHNQTLGILPVFSRTISNSRFVSKPVDQTIKFLKSSQKISNLLNTRFVLPFDKVYPLVGSNGLDLYFTDAGLQNKLMCRKNTMIVEPMFDKKLNRVSHRNYPPIPGLSQKYELLSGYGSATAQTPYKHYNPILKRQSSISHRKEGQITTIIPNKQNHSFYDNQVSVESRKHKQQTPRILAQIGYNASKLLKQTWAKRKAQHCYSDLLVYRHKLKAAITRTKHLIDVPNEKLISVLAPYSEVIRFKVVQTLWPELLISEKSEDTPIHLKKRTIKQNRRNIFKRQLRRLYIKKKKTHNSFTTPYYKTRSLLTWLSLDTGLKHHLAGMRNIEFDSNREMTALGYKATVVHRINFMYYYFISLTGTRPRPRRAQRPSRRWDKIRAAGIHRNSEIDSHLITSPSSWKVWQAVNPEIQQYTGLIASLEERAFILADALALSSIVHAKLTKLSRIARVTCSMSETYASEYQLLFLCRQEYGVMQIRLHSLLSQITTPENAAFLLRKRLRHAHLILGKLRALEASRGYTMQRRAVTPSPTDLYTQSALVLHSDKEADLIKQARQLQARLTSHMQAGTSLFRGYLGIARIHQCPDKTFGPRKKLFTLSRRLRSRDWHESIGATGNFRRKRRTTYKPILGVSLVPKTTNTVYRKLITNGIFSYRRYGLLRRRGILELNNPLKQRRIGKFFNKLKNFTIKHYSISTQECMGIFSYFTKSQILTTIKYCTHTSILNNINSLTISNFKKNNSILFTSITHNLPTNFNNLAVMRNIYTWAPNYFIKTSKSIFSFKNRKSFAGGEKFLQARYTRKYGGKRIARCYRARTCSFNVRAPFLLSHRQRYRVSRRQMTPPRIHTVNEIHTPTYSHVVTWRRSEYLPSGKLRYGTAITQKRIYTFIRRFRHLY